MSDLALLVQLQAKVAAFLAGLSADRLVALAQGRAVLTVADVTEAPAEAPREVPEAATPARPAPARKAPGGRSRSQPAGSIDADATVADLRACKTIDEATERLAALKLGVPQLKEIARSLNIGVGGTKAELARRILTLTVGARSKHAGLQRG